MKWGRVLCVRGERRHFPPSPTSLSLSSGVSTDSGTTGPSLVSLFIIWRAWLENLVDTLLSNNIYISEGTNYTYNHGFIQFQSIPVTIRNFQVLCWVYGTGWNSVPTLILYIIQTLYYTVQCTSILCKICRLTGGYSFDQSDLLTLQHSNSTHLYIQYIQCTHTLIYTHTHTHTYILGMFRIHLSVQIILSISLSVALVARELTKKFFSIQLIQETLAPTTPIFCESLYRQRIKNRIFSHDALILLHCN